MLLKTNEIHYFYFCCSSVTLWSQSASLQLQKCRNSRIQSYFRRETPLILLYDPYNDKDIKIQAISSLFYNLKSPTV